MQVSKEGIERLKAANELAAVIGERGIELKRKGRQLFALCPFHRENTPSFSVSPAKGLFHCFSCGKAGDVIGFVVHHDKVSFPEAVRMLAVRAGLDAQRLMEDRTRVLRATPLDALTPPPEDKPSAEGAPLPGAPMTAILSRVVEYYHRSFCEREDAQEYLRKRGLTDMDLWRMHNIGYADGSFLKLVPKHGEVRDELVRLGVITAEGRELLGGCIVVPIPDPLTAEWTNLYGRGLRTPRHCYLPGPLRGVLNFQAARLSPEVILTESVLDALSFHQAGISTAIPIYGTNGFTSDHLDLLKREGVRRVILALDNDEPGRKATDTLKEKLTAAGISVRVASFPAGVKDANELLAGCNGEAGTVFRQVLDGPPQAREGSTPPVASIPLGEKAGGILREGEQLSLSRDGIRYDARVHSLLLGRLRATVKASRGEAFHVDTLDLYASRSRTEFARRVAKAMSVEAQAVEGALLALLVEAERAVEQDRPTPEASPAPAMSEAERAEALSFLKREDLLDQVGRDIEALGYVGEETNKRLLYLVAISRKLLDPLSAIIMSASGSGKSGLTEVIEKLCPPEDVVLFTRLTPQSLYYTEPGYLDQKLVVVEERYGSADADYSIRVLQSRKKLSVAAPIKDPQTGNMRTKVFTVEARCAFIEATTASGVNHENATRCFELSMDESKEQTERILERQRLLQMEAGLVWRETSQRIARRHWNAQRLLEPLPVVVPFADKLTFPSSWLRARRDQARFLSLIAVSAFLHQHQRERRGGAIVASTADYAVAYGLAAEVLKETLSDVKKPLREAYKRVRELCEQRGGSVSRREIREALHVPDSTVRRWLQDLVDFEYVAVAALDGKAGQGRTVRYQLLDREPKENEVLGLPSPAELEARLRGGQ